MKINNIKQAINLISEDVHNLRKINFKLGKELIFQEELIEKYINLKIKLENYSEYYIVDGFSDGYFLNKEYNEDKKRFKLIKKWVKSDAIKLLIVLNY